MKRYLRFWGASDDLVEVDGANIREEFNCYKPRGWNGTRWSCILRHRGDSMRVFAVYGPGGVWGFGVAQVAGDSPLPDWEVLIALSEDCEYSVELLIEVPEGVTLEEEAPDAGG